MIHWLIVALVFIGNMTIFMWGLVLNRCKTGAHLSCLSKKEKRNRKEEKRNRATKELYPTVNGNDRKFQKDHRDSRAKFAEALVTSDYSAFNPPGKSINYIQRREPNITNNHRQALL